MGHKSSVDSSESQKKILESFLLRQGLISKNSEIKVHYTLLSLMKSMPSVNKEVYTQTQDRKSEIKSSTNS